MPLDLPPQQIVTICGSMVGMYGVWVLKRLVINVESLNEKMAVILNRVSAKERSIDDHEARIRSLEKGVSVFENGIRLHDA